MKYEVVDYFDVWTEPTGDVEDGIEYVTFTVNDQARTDYVIDIDDNDDDKDILVKLVEVGYLNPSAVKDCYVEWLDDTMLEVYLEEGSDAWEDQIRFTDGMVVGGYPVCRLDKVDVYSSTRVKKNNKIMEGRRVDLKPEFVDSRQSFYNKAQVEINDDGSFELYSYNTPVAKVDKDGNIVYTEYGAYSQTTNRHIREFLAQFAKETNYGRDYNWKQLNSKPRRRDV